MNTKFANNIFASWAWALVLVISFAVSAEASTTNAKISAYYLLTKQLEIKFRLIDLEDYDEFQFHQSLIKKAPLFTRLAWVQGQKVLEIVYIKTLRNSVKRGLVIEVYLPNGPWKNPGLNG